MGRICSSMGAYSVFTQGRGNAVTKLLKDAPQKELRSEVGGGTAGIKKRLSR